QLEILVDQFDRPPRIARRKERAEIQSAVFLDAPRDEDSRIRLVHRELQIRETLVILEMDVVARLVLLDQRRLEDQRFHFVVGKEDRKSTRLNSSHVAISYAVFCLKKKT